MRKISQIKPEPKVLCTGMYVCLSMRKRSLDNGRNRLVTILTNSKVNSKYWEGSKMTKQKPKMVVCPKAKTCKHCQNNIQYGHRKPHEHRLECDMQTFHCPACIPVPSTPASETISLKDSQGKEWNANVIRRRTPASVPLPHELLTIPQLKLEIAKFIGEQYHPHENFDTLPHGVRADLLYFADEIVKICHQSEANIEEQLTEIVCSQYTRAEKAEARIKELSDLNEKQSQMKCKECPFNKVTETKSFIGEWLQKWYNKKANWSELKAFIDNLRQGVMPKEGADS